LVVDVGSRVTLIWSVRLSSRKASPVLRVLANEVKGKVSAVQARLPKRAAKEEEDEEEGGAATPSAEEALKR